MAGNSLVESAFAIMAGNMLGAVSDRVVTIIDERVKTIESFKLDGTTGSLLDSFLGVFLHVGFLSVGTQFVTNALPWILSDGPSFSLYMMGLAATSPHLFNHLKTINSIILNEAIYSKALGSQEDKMEPPAAAAPTTIAGMVQSD